ncbi:MAG: peptidoglycan editing factor PgeF [Gammaproteobacteria bacterium]
MTVNSKDWIEADWPAAAHVRAGTSLRVGGVSQGNYASLNLAAHVGDDANSVLANRDSFIARHKLPAAPAWLQQVHGNRIINLDTEQAESGKADGSMTRRHNTVCAVLTADCVPLLFSDEQGECIAAVHAGWRGTCKGIIDRVVDLFPEPEQLLVWIGPCISKACYEVGQDVVSACLAYREASQTALEQTDATHWQLDMRKLVKLSLTANRVNRVYDSGLCTYEQADLFYSYRRDGKTGRTASLIWME